MKLLIAVDMEGISGVVNWDQVKPGTSEWQRFRRIMTEEVNAAISGAMDAGVNEVFVSDGHWNSDNIMIDLLDPRARLNCGLTKPHAMVQSIDEGVDVAFFIGFHARAGTQSAVLDHTWSNATIANVWLNEILVGETGLNAAMCGFYDVPVLLLSGDQAVTKEVRDLIPGVHTVVSKHALGRFGASCLHPKEVQNLIREGAKFAIQSFQNGQGAEVFKITQPVSVQVEFKSTEMADRTQIIPGVERVSGKFIQYETDDMPAAYQMFRTIAGLAG
ncbi:MAG TPA: M55 family metallopeptidase [Anaerolineaceae bacterium]|nr:M55 family metallopeptidase [Anaerolineaceae bacterium]